MQISTSTLLNTTSLAWDWWLLGVLVVVGLIYAFTYGKHRSILTLLSLYIAAFIVDHVPFLYSWIKGSGEPYRQMIVFGVLLIVLTVFFTRGILGRNLYGFSFSSQVEIVLFSFLQLGLLVMIFGLFAPGPLIAHFTPATQAVFTHEYARLGWMLVPLAFVIFAP
ncbi:MAG: hypothetical protein UX10_C0003G0011 [Candidatus Magasanikbacteria bacterium GW2011_GWA2_45_39]|uniref:Uncharacterized protein n=2 Tax=Candidatus Magasanikiibacteriota TaxID=1752731 RepID=A0A0G1MZ47_9BACT|nr:MAG: hypothetical protein UX10_C0003G0011 [Candidatus Magasanikbacteria bacterium GW2011_GWA2_45_39]KKU13387.1 MAG: hypothetical protein UX20_C0023G0012 [Candidatus Magasanikbacteria bacterium GW2011_GWC2_45_8]HBW74210.1 hypothetical protein [Candidatus Magasanikbacteria bacterium]